MQKQIKRTTAPQPELIGCSLSMKRIKDLIRKASQCDPNILIIGESGTGKEIIAQMIHYLSPRHSQSFVPVDCGALPEHLLESELFGHEKGAFTGAVGVKIGLLEFANKGTLLLDEVLELTPALQVKLLRAIQERQIRRLGGNNLIPLDVRIVAATNRNPEEAVKQKKLREDLYYRLKVISIIVPPLRERRSDIPLLIAYFLPRLWEKTDGLKKIFSDKAIDLLTNYNWPGNVRELQNVIEQTYYMSDNKKLVSVGDEIPFWVIGTNDLPLQIRENNVIPTSFSQNLPFQIAKKEMVNQFEKKYITLVLKKYYGNVTRAANQAGISRKTFYQLVNKHKINK